MKYFKCKGTKSKGLTNSLKKEFNHGEHLMEYKYKDVVVYKYINIFK